MEDDAALDDGKPDRHAVSRMCVVTRQVRPISELLRFVVGPDNILVPDIKNRLPGRGVWVSADHKTVNEARIRKAFGRALKVNVTVSDDLATQVGDLLARDALQMLSLANKAGGLVTGFAKIEGSRGPFLALVQARDGSQAEIARLRGHCRGKGLRRSDPQTIEAFSSVELGLSIGREHVIHAALMALDVCRVFLDRAHRYAEFQAGGPAKHANASANGPSSAFGVSGS